MDIARHSQQAKAEHMVHVLMPVNWSVANMSKHLWNSSGFLQQQDWVYCHQLVEKSFTSIEAFLDITKAANTLNH